MPGAKRDPSSFIQATTSIELRGRKPGFRDGLDTLESGHNAIGAVLELSPVGWLSNARAGQNGRQIGLASVETKKQVRRLVV